MSLADCVIATSTETIDPTLSAGVVALSATTVVSTTAVLPALNASWHPFTNPYVQGIQFDYGPVDGLSGRTVTAAQRTSPWTATSGIVAGKSYSVRYRAAGIPPLFGSWSAYTTIAIPVPNGIAPPAPGASAWTATGTTISGGGSSFPAIHLAGAIDVTTGVTDIIVEFAPHGTTGWKTFGHYPINTTSLDITAVGATVLYDVAVSYDNSGAIGPRRILNNGGAGYTAGGFTGSGGTNIVTPAALEWSDVTASGSGAQSAVMAAQTIATINVPITLALTFTGSATWTYQKNGASVAFASGDTVTVSAGDSLGFTPSASATTSGILTITNQTDSNTVLDAPTYSLTVTSSTVTPSPTPTWSDISETSYASHPVSGTTGAVSILGINVPITLGITFTGSGALSYNKNAGGWTSIASGGTIVVSVNDTLNFRAASGGSTSGTVTVANNSNSGATLDTFAYDLTVNSGPWP